MAYQRQDDSRDAESEEVGYQLDDEDIRSILLAERIEAIFRDIQINKPVRGKEDAFKTYKRMGPLRTIALIILLFQIIFSKPQWCREKGQEIDENCMKDTNEVNYYRSQLPVFDTGMDTYITIFCLIFLASSRLSRLQLNQITPDAVQAAIGCVVLTLTYIGLCVLHSMGAFTYIAIQDIISMLFILIYNDSIRRASARMIRIAAESIEILIVFASALLAFACLARIIFFGSVDV